MSWISGLEHEAICTQLRDEIARLRTGLDYEIHAHRDDIEAVKRSLIDRFQAAQNEIEHWKQKEAQQNRRRILAEEEAAAYLEQLHSLKAKHERRA